MKYIKPELMLIVSLLGTFFQILSVAGTWLPQVAGGSHFDWLQFAGDVISGAAPEVFLAYVFLLGASILADAWSAETEPDS